MNCYFCDDRVMAGVPFPIGRREETICEKCFIKNENRRRAKGING